MNHGRANTKTPEEYRSKPGIYEYFESLCIPEPNSGCWLWLGTHSAMTVYGKINYKGAFGSAHRASYMLFKGEAPQGLVVRHTCNNKACVNPEHLKLGTQSQNVRDYIRSVFGSDLKTHCPHGHEFTPENTYVRTDKARECIICRKKYMRAAYERRKEAKANQRLSGVIL